MTHIASDDGPCGTVPTDRELLTAHLDGDPHALSEVFRRHRATLWRTAFRLMRHHQDAEDITQVALLRAWRYAHTFEGRSTVVAWLRTVLIHAAYLELQRRDRLPFVYGDADDIILDLAGPAPFVERDRTDVVNLRLELENAVHELPEPHRTTFYFAVMRGLTEAETAAMLAVRPGTVKSRLARARALLAAELGTPDDPGTE